MVIWPRQMGNISSQGVYTLSNTTGIFYQPVVKTNGNCDGRYDDFSWDTGAVGTGERDTTLRLPYS